MYSLNISSELCLFSAASRDTTDDIEEDSPSVDAEVDIIPNEADFLLAMATVSGYVSYRSRTEGSWFITALTTTLEKYAER